MSELIKKQHFGVEIEFTGITRIVAANVLSEYFNNPVRYVPQEGYDTRKIEDTTGRSWKIVSDSSITSEIKNGTKDNGKFRYITTYNSDYKVELVTPKLEYADIPTLQEVVRKIREAGAKVNGSCGIHVHVDAANHTAKSLKNIAFIMSSKEDLLEKSLKIRPGGINNYCKKADPKFIQELKNKKVIDMNEIKKLWYNGNLSDATRHYSVTRYRMLNLHNVWFRGTVEFRMFNSTLHAGKVKAYVNLSLAISAQAIEQKRASADKTVTDNEKYTFRCWLLRLGLIGDEFSTTREHLLANLTGNAAWRNDPNTYDSYNNRNNRVAV